MKRSTAILFALLPLLGAGCFQMKVKTPPININIPPIDAGGGGYDSVETEKRDRKGDEPGTSGLPGDGAGRWVGLAVDVAGRVMLGTEQGALFYAYDTLAYPGKPVHLAARLQMMPKLQKVSGVTVSFYHGDRLVGQAVTDSRGLAHITWTPPHAGDYHFRARITGVGEKYKRFLAISDAPLLVAAREANTSFVVIDMDHTIIDAGFFRVLVGGAKPMPRSAEVAKRIARRHGIVYLTQRPEVLTRKSKTWLVRHGYPAGPVMLAGGTDFLDSARFKTGKLKALRGAYPSVRFGIGDKCSDAEAYVSAGLTAYLIPHCKAKPKDLRKKAAEIRRLRRSSRMHVVENWYDIEAGIFDGKTFPPAACARALGRRADRLEADERRRKKKDDDD